MIRLVVVVEGATERAFVRQVLVPHLGHHGVSASATIGGKIKAGHQGRRAWGGGPFGPWLEDIRQILGNGADRKLRVTTLFDLYGLPRDFPGWAAHHMEPDTNRRCDALQQALGRTVEDHRLIPYLQRHEFEALVLAALPVLREVLDARDDLVGLDVLTRELAGRAPEDINDGQETAPSKRLERRVPGYDKLLHGPLVTEGASLSALRAACPRFDGWVGRLEALGGEGG